MATRIQLSSNEPSAEEWKRILTRHSPGGDLQDMLIYRIGQGVFAVHFENDIPSTGKKLTDRDIREIIYGTEVALQTSPRKVDVTFGSEQVKMSDDYQKEVYAHLANELEKIEQTFNFKGTGKIRVEVSGKETHYGGKVPLFLTFETDGSKSIKLVYKPRSVLPEIVLENCRSQLSQRSPRKLLDCNDHGYDAFIDGKKIEIPPEQAFRFEQELIRLGNLKKENLCLLYAIYGLGIEDTHPENFIVDKDNILHFVDAESYLTNMAVSIDQLFIEPDLSSDEEQLATPTPTLKKDSGIETSLARVTRSLKEQLLKHPTRLVFCSTKFYVSPDLPDRPRQVRLGEGLLLKKLDSFEDYHTAQIAKFLFMRKKINFSGIELITIEIVRKKVADALEQEGLRKINEELRAAQVYRDQKNLLELPLFKYHLEEEWIECPLTKQKVHVKKEEK